MHRSSLFALAFASVVLAACGSSYKSPTSPTPVSSPQVVVVGVEDDQFVPKDVSINPGDTVRWVLMGSANAGHTVTAEDGSFDSGKIFTQSGAVFEHTFSKAGTTTMYHCQTHYVCCHMQGAVQVGQNAPNPAPGY